ncbi:sugar kinase [Erythrobacter sp. HA6-11]
MQGTVVCFGEILNRLSPPAPLLLEQTNTLEICTGGAEANVAVALANLGRSTRMVSVLPDNRMGDRARKSIAAHGVDVSTIASGPGRMGLYYFTPPSGHRSGEVIYDRAHSAFAATTPDQFDFEAALSGASHLHISGITLALSEALAQATIDFAKAAKAAGASVSFDGNYRAALWAKARHEPREWIARALGLADLVFGNHKDAALVLDRAFDGDGPERRREASLALIDAFPSITAVASTARHIHDGNAHRITGRIDTPSNHAESAEWVMNDIVDRVGTGDAFAAGVLHGWLCASDDLQAAVDFGMAMTALKHATWGDFSLATQPDVELALGGQSDVQR